MRAAADFIGTIKKNDRVANKHAKIALIVTVWKSASNGFYKNAFAID